MCRLIGLTLMLSLMLVPAAGWAAYPYSVELLSVGSGGTPADYESDVPAVSADGQFVAYWSGASNLVYSDPNGLPDVFVRDRRWGFNDLVTVAADSSPSNGTRWGVGPRALAISPEGRFVVFSSDASNLVAGDTNGLVDVFVRDRAAGRTVRVSVSSSGEQGNADSGVPESVDISADGRYVLFTSMASNLVPDDTNGALDVFVRDLVGGTTQRVSVAADDTQAPLGGRLPSISADGGHVAFVSDSPLVPEDTNGCADIYVRDLAAGITVPISVSAGGEVGNAASQWFAPVQSSDGRYVAFSSLATNLAAGDTNGYMDVLVYDRATGYTQIASLAEGGALANQHCGYPGISADGRYVTFDTLATNLVAGDTIAANDVFVRDLLAGHTTRTSLTEIHGQPTDHSQSPVISADGRCVAMISAAALVAGDTNIFTDIYLAPNELLAVPATPPAAPSGLAATPQGGSRAVLTWNDNSFGETGFLVERSTHPTLYFQPVAATAANQGGLTVYGLAPTQAVYYRVRAYNAAGQSDCSETVAVSWGPTNFTATPLSSSRLRLTWADTTGESGYVLERTIFVAKGLSIGLAANTTSYTDSTCSRGLSYTYRLYATHPAGDSYQASLTVIMPYFDDVLPASGQYLFVQAMAREGITSGCQQTPPLYCPEAAVTRGQMAVFICRAAGWLPIVDPTPTFSDVPASHPLYGYIETMADQGVTTGCGGGKYCPDAPVTRGQMAVFLCRAAGLATQNPATPTFTDVPKTSGQYTYIEGMFTAAITAGCVTTIPRQYCPNSPVTRGQMAVFLCRAFDIPTRIVY